MERRLSGAQMRIEASDEHVTMRVLIRVTIMTSERRCESSSHCARHVAVHSFVLEKHGDNVVNRRVVRVQALNQTVAYNGKFQSRCFAHKLSKMVENYVSHASNAPVWTSNRLNPGPMAASR